MLSALLTATARFHRRAQSPQRPDRTICLVGACGPVSTRSAPEWIRMPNLLTRGKSEVRPARSNAINAVPTEFLQRLFGRVGLAMASPCLHPPWSVHHFANSWPPGGPSPGLKLSLPVVLDPNLGEVPINARARPQLHDRALLRVFGTGRQVAAPHTVGRRARLDADLSGHGLNPARGERRSRLVRRVHDWLFPKPPGSHDSRLLRQEDRVRHCASMYPGLGWRRRRDPVASGNDVGRRSSA